MPKTLKQILAGLRIGADFLLLIFFIVDMLEGYDVGIDLFMSLVLAVDTFLSVDYITTLNKKEKLENKLDVAEYQLYEAQQRNADREMADSIRTSRYEQEEKERRENEEREKREETERQQREEIERLKKLLKEREEQLQKEAQAKAAEEAEELDPEELSSMLKADFQNINEPDPN